MNISRLHIDFASAVGHVEAQNRRHLNRVFHGQCAEGVFNASHRIHVERNDGSKL